MVTTPHFMRERRKHSQTIVWLCHRKPFLLRIVLHLQIPRSSTSICSKSCCVQCYDDWVTSIIRAMGVRASLGHREPSWGREISPSRQRDSLCSALHYLGDFPEQKFGAEYPKVQRTKGRTQPPRRARRPRSRSRGTGALLLPRRWLSTSPARKLQPLSLVQGDVANKWQTAKPVSQDGSER